MEQVGTLGSTHRASRALIYWLVLISAACWVARSKDRDLNGLTRALDPTDCFQGTDQVPPFSCGSAASR